MRSLLARLGGMFGRRGDSPPAEPSHPQDLHVVVPDHVELPLPRAPREEMSVPASINGRDLSTGRL
ncbi:hypothetical protein [Rhizobium sp. SSA_523]|uniref:hypothetical protein n=1 Tax=Rhizobium sp. SSA_523 TaxID=2952477 RepID=UPI002090463C|nr:hypothetical protein [Rhizobium sp. SSA_523]MCO5731723.1 hypothetical protein [Rhizobium sp. SSA_523]WKC22904.1 hypothetical protein QTJ18_18920 [Rhizobium sp. SSA_523]